MNNFKGVFAIVDGPFYACNFNQLYEQYKKQSEAIP